MIGYMMSSQLSDEIHQHGSMKKLMRFEQIFLLEVTITILTKSAHSPFMKVFFPDSFWKSDFNLLLKYTDDKYTMNSNSLDKKITTFHDILAKIDAPFSHVPCTKFISPMTLC